jgi:hypothetical protein
MPNLTLTLVSKRIPPSKLQLAGSLKDKPFAAKLVPARARGEAEKGALQLPVQASLQAEGPKLAERSIAHHLRRVVHV